MVTNPGTRDWTVTASLFATLDEMFGPRTICGIGRGDSARRVQGERPIGLDEVARSIEVIRGLVRGEEVDFNGQLLKLPWWKGSRAFEVWMAAYGPKALKVCGEVADGYILQLADVDVTKWMIAHVRDAAAAAGATRRRSRSASPHPRTSATTTSTCASSAAGSVAWSATTSRRSSAATGATAAACRRRSPTTSRDREGYDYSEHGRAGNTHTEFVPDEIVERFCILGPVEAHLERLRELRSLGVDQFSIYLQHDDKDGTLEAYGEHVLPRRS